MNLLPNTSVISQDGKVRGTLVSAGTKMATVLQEDGTEKRIKNDKLVPWRRGPQIAPIDTRKFRRKRAKAARKANRGPRANHR